MRLSAEPCWEAREEAELAVLEAEYRDPGNDHWWDR